MKAQLRNHVAALCLLAPAAATFMALPSAALAQLATPEVRALEVTSDGGINPGSRLRFVLRGSPGAQASVRIRGVDHSIPLNEVNPGLYMGRYVVTRADRIEEGNPIRAILRHGNRTVSANYTVPDALGHVAAAPPQRLRIDRFDVAPVDRLAPGTELRFSLDGMPGAVATVALPGIGERVRMREVQPGHYEGSYTIRRSDNVNAPGRIVATLRDRDRTVTTQLAQPLLAAVQGRPGPIASGDFRDRPRGQVIPGPHGVPMQILSPPNNALVDANLTHIRGRTVPFAGVEIRAQAVPGQNGGVQTVFEKFVRADANGHFEFDFFAPSPVPGTRYNVTMTARTPEAMSETHLVLFQRQG
jgi:hypothetical protein